MKPVTITQDGVIKEPAALKAAKVAGYLTGIKRLAKSRTGPPTRLFNKSMDKC